MNFEISRSKQLSLRSEGHRLPRRRRVAIYTLHEGCASESSTISLFRTDRKISIVAAHLSDEEARAKPILHILITPRAVSCQRRVAIVLQLTALLQLLSVANAQSRHCTAMFCRVLLNALVERFQSGTVGRTLTSSTTSQQASPTQTILPRTLCTLFPRGIIAFGGLCNEIRP